MDQVITSKRKKGYFCFQFKQFQFEASLVLEQLALDLSVARFGLADLRVGLLGLLFERLDLGLERLFVRLGRINSSLQLPVLLQNVVGQRDLVFGTPRGRQRRQLLWSPGEPRKLAPKRKSAAK